MGGGGGSVHYIITVLNYHQQRHSLVSDLLLIFIDHKKHYILPLVKVHNENLQFGISEFPTSLERSTRPAAFSSQLYDTSLLTGLLSFHLIITLTALPLSILLSGKTAAPQRTSAQESGLTVNVVISRQTELTVLWCGLKATYQHAAFL